eukprot:TRINITY_DN2127_c0_g1_i14.p1 TRINITY_DN2127_c0_g1~~TRINITY_DN2127_c0_g1_i14.p1  ORF type:complete len:127 (+),score=32.50 TRINITY_DN2127_c0_g1_i14:110-490(+)
MLDKYEKERKPEELDQDYYQSVVNAHFNIAKVFSKLYSNEKPKRIELLSKSLKHYQFIIDFIRNKVSEKGNLSFLFNEQLKMCKEMCEMLPVKISKIYNCLLYTSDAADDLLCVDLGGRRIIKKKK